MVVIRLTKKFVIKESNMKIIIYAGGKQWAIDESMLIAFLRSNGQEVVAGGTSGGYNKEANSLGDGPYILKG